ncbi:MAG: hypothetical protein ACTSPU_00400 [Promethearchaeota archaeon]|nr:hypothetical protein [Candidatus Lokiarchaeota archaeon]
MIEEENNFLEFLKYQIIQKNKFEHVVRKIPLFKSMIQERHKTILKMIDKFEDVRRREVYDMLVHEFNTVSKRI